MKIIYNPITIILFTILVVMFSFSMRRNDQSMDQTVNYIETLVQNKQTLENQISALEKKIELASHPLAKERIIRDQLWQKKAGEENLELQGFDYQVRTVALPIIEKSTPLETWQALLVP